MTNLGQLASELRYKNYSSTEIAEILQQIQGQVAAPDPLFADAEKYPKQRKFTTFRMTMTLAYGVILVGWVVSPWVLPLVLPAGSIQGSWTLAGLTLAVAALVALAGNLYSRRIPRLER